MGDRLKNYKRCMEDDRWLEYIYLFILGCYLLRVFFDTTLFNLEWSDWYYGFIRTALVSFYLLRLGIKGYKNMRECLFDIVYFIIFLLIYKSTGYWFLIELGFFVLLAKDIPYKKILKVYLWIGGGVVFITILAALTGCITDLVYYERNSFKHAFGIVYTTDFGAHILFLILAYLAVKDKVPNILESGVMLLISYTLYKYSGTRTTSGVIILLVIGGGYIYVTDKYIKNGSDVKKLTRRMIGFIDGCFALSVPLFALISLIATIYYSSGNSMMNKINTIVTGRLQLGNEAIQKYGFSLWGTPFDMIGAGGNVVKRLNYNFVDSSYVIILVRYGAVFFVLAMIGFWWISIKAKRRKNRYFLIILSAMALSSVIEHHLLELAYNAFLLLMFADFSYSYKLESASLKLKQIRKESVFKYCCIFGVVLILWINCNKILAYMRTLFSLLNLNESENYKYFMLVILIGGIIIISTGSMGYRLFYTISGEKNEKNIIRYGFSTMLCVILIVAVFQVSNRVILNKAGKYKDAILINNEVIEQLDQIDGYKLYIDQLPYLYMEKTDTTKRVIQGDFYTSPEEKAVIITDITNEIPDLIKAGYVCGKISEISYLYTNDEFVTNMLRQKGIEMYQYYAEKSSVDLRNLAVANDLTIDADGSLLIEGESKSLIHGPWVTIYSGRIQVDYELQLLDTDVMDEEVATIRFSSGGGSNIIKEVSVKRSDFDENGNYIVSLVHDIPDLEDVEFLLFAKGNTELKLNSLTYGKVAVE